MPTKLRIRIVSVLALSSSLMSATAMAENQSRCVDVSVPKDAIMARNGRWIELTPEQWQFMRGIYAMNPQTPAGLPYGDKAVLAQVEGDSGGMILFIDGDKACTPMPVPRELLDMMFKIGSGDIAHEGSGS